MGKGLRKLVEDPKFFFESDAFEKLGLGKNMVQSLQHWLVSTEVAEINGVGKERTLNLTSFGKWLLDNDPALKHFDTVAILHYNIASRDEPSTTWYWYFNHFTETIADKEEIFEQLNSWVQERETRNVAENSIRRDVDCMIRMYTTAEEPDDPEEVLLSPFSKLRLIKDKKGTAYKNEIRIPNNNLLFIKYALCKYSEDFGQFEVSLEEIINKNRLLGKIYNMGSSSIVRALSSLENDFYYKINFTRTNNLDMVILPKVTVKELLDNHKH